MKDQQFTIGELARLTGVSIETIRYYERIRLMPRTPRTDGGRRVFGASSLNTLNFIRRCRDLGFSLDDVRALLALRSAQSCCMDVKSIASRHLQTVRAKLLDLAEMEASLAGLIARCSDDAGSECPVLDALDAGVFEERNAPA